VVFGDGQDPVEELAAQGAGFPKSACASDLGD
jgi:hypothetical protein